MTSQGEDAAKALQKLIDMSNKYSSMEMDGDQLKESISERIEATTELKELLLKAQENQRHSYHQWRASD